MVSSALRLRLSTAARTATMRPMNTTSWLHRGRLLAAASFFLLPAPALAQDGDSVAIVEGRSVSRQQLADALIEAHGLKMLQQLVLLELAKAETDRLGIRIARAQVETELRSSLDQLAREAGLSGADATPENKNQALDALLEQKNISRLEYMIAMERNAHLRACVERDFKVEEETLREEFARTYGERVVVRHIQLSDLRKLTPLLDQINSGADFAQLAREFSENRDSGPRGGEMEPFTFQDERVPPAMRELAFSLRVGAVSAPLMVGGGHHVLKLERRIAPENVKFEDVRSDVERAMRERFVTRAMGERMEQLFKQAKIRVLDPNLRRKYDEFLRAAAAGPQP